MGRYLLSIFSAVTSVVAAVVLCKTISDLSARPDDVHEVSLLQQRLHLTRVSMQGGKGNARSNSSWKAVEFEDGKPHPVAGESPDVAAAFAAAAFVASAGDIAATMPMVALIRFNSSSPSTFKAVRSRGPPATSRQTSWPETWFVRLGVQFIFGLAYYFFIVSKYPVLPKDFLPTQKAVDLQDKGVLCAMCTVRTTTRFHACCCSAPRAAHTFHSAGVLNYWFGLILMTALPCCTLFLADWCTNLKERLGGTRRGLCIGCLCSCCCSCCVIAQDAEAVDLNTGVETTILGVTEILKCQDK